MSALSVASLTLAPQDIAAQAQAVPDGNRNSAEAARQFEGMLMSYLFQQMRQTVQPSGLFGEQGNARSTYEYLLDQATATNAMDAGKGLGLSQKLEAAWAARAAKK